MVTMLIVDDESIIREGLRDMIDWGSIGVNVAGLAADGFEAISLAKSLNPDIVLSDVIIPGIDGIAFCRQLHDLQPDTRIIMISAYQDARYIRAAFKYDALDYILKPFDNEEMLRVVKKAADQVIERRRQKQEIAEMKEKIRHSLPAMKQQFFSNLIDGRAGNSGEIAQQAGLLGIEVPNGYGFCVLQVWLDPVAGHDGRSVVSDFKTALKELLDHNQLCPLYTIDGVRCVILHMLATGENGESLAAQIKELLNVNMGLQTTIGIGSAIGTLGEVGLSCSQAETACNYRLLLGRNKVIYYGNIAQIAISDLPPQLRAVRDEAIECSRAGNTTGTIDAIHSLFDQLRAGSQADGYFIRSVCIDIYTGIAYAMDDEAWNGRTICRFIQELKPLEFIDDMEWLVEESVTAFSQVQKTVSLGEASKAVRRLKEIIAERYMQRLTLSSLAKEVYLTPTYVAALFKKETTHTLNDYITAVRMEKAKEALKKPGVNIQALAENVGYQDVNYFNHLFKKHTGKTPCEYRKLCR